MRLVSETSYVCLILPRATLFGSCCTLTGPGDHIMSAARAASVIAADRPHRCVVHQGAPQDAQPCGHRKTLVCHFKHVETRFAIDLIRPHWAANPAFGRER